VEAGLYGFALFGQVAQRGGRREQDLRVLELLGGLLDQFVDIELAAAVATLYSDS